MGERRLFWNFESSGVWRLSSRLKIWIWKSQIYILLNKFQAFYLMTVLQVLNGINLGILYSI